MHGRDSFDWWRARVSGVAAIGALPAPPAGADDAACAAAPFAAAGRAAVAGFAPALSDAAGFCAAGLAAAVIGPLAALSHAPWLGLAKPMQGSDGASPAMGLSDYSVFCVHPEAGHLADVSAAAGSDWAALASVRFQGSMRPSAAPSRCALGPNTLLRVLFKRSRSCPMLPQPSIAIREYSLSPKNAGRMSRSTVSIEYLLRVHRPTFRSPSHSLEGLRR